MTTDVRRVLDDAAPILLLAVIATLVAAAIVGLALWPISGQPLVVCLLLGAVVSTTDPAAVIAIFRDVGAPARLTRLVEGELLLNDASAIVAYTVLLGIIVTGAEPHLGDGAIAVLRLLHRRWNVRRRGRAADADPGRLDTRQSARRGDADAGARLSRLHRGRPRVPRLGRGRDAGGGHDGERVRAHAHRPGQLVVPRRRVAAGGVLGAFAGVPARLHHGAQTAGRPQRPRPRPARRARRRRLRLPARGAVPPPAALEPRPADEADQHRLQDRHRLGRPARGADAGARPFRDRDARRVRLDPGVRRGSGDRPRVLHPPGQRGHAAPRHPRLRTRPAVADRPGAARPGARSLLRRRRRPDPKGRRGPHVRRGGDGGRARPL